MWPLPVVSRSSCCCDVKSSHRENERRWLLTGLPATADSWPGIGITDHYLTGTRLRLRRTVDAHGEVTLKLGQKIPVTGDNPSDVWHTTMYLDDVEYRVLRRLGSNELRKTRLRPPPDWLAVERPEPTGEDSTPAVAVDVFGGELQGLILAELSSNTVQTAPELPVRLRPFAAREVTGEGDFGGGALARYGFPSPAAARDVVIIHGGGDHTYPLVAAALKGSQAAIDGLNNASAGAASVRVREMRPQDVAADLVHRSAAIILVTSTRFGALPGDVKEMFDRHFDEWAAAERSPVCGVICRGATDPSGAARQLAPILAGLGWKMGRPIEELVGPVTAGQEESAFELAAVLTAEALG